MIYTNINYNNEFITCLIKDVDNKLALVGNKDYKNNIYGLGLKMNIEKYKDLITLRNILEKVLQCSSCYKDIKIEDVVDIVKKELKNC